MTIALSKIFPGLTFNHKYEESGEEFCGLLTYKYGNVFDHVEGAWGVITTHNDNNYNDNEDNEKDEVKNRKE